MPPEACREEGSRKEDLQFRQLPTPGTRAAGALYYQGPRPGYEIRPISSRSGCGCCRCCQALDWGSSMSLLVSKCRPSSFETWRPLSGLSTFAPKGNVIANHWPPSTIVACPTLAGVHGVSLLDLLECPGGTWGPWYGPGLQGGRGRHSEPTIGRAGALAFSGALPRRPWGPVSRTR
jgi:hypothetical protein